MKTPKKVEAKKGFAAMSEDESKGAAKALHAYHMGKASQCEDEGEKGIHLAAAEKYKAMCGEEEGEGDLTITHKGPAEDPADDKDAAPDQESEDEAKKKASEAEDEDENEDEKESMRAEIFALKLDKKLSESGLPEVFHAGVRFAAAGKTDKQVDQIIESRINEQNYLLQESGNTARPVFKGGTKPGLDAVLAKRGL